MFTQIIALALIVVSFISIYGQDIRELKSAIAFMVMLGLGLLSAYQGKLKKFGNRYALMLVGFVWLSTMLAPGSGTKLMNMDLGIFWAWKPFTYILAYLLGIMAIASYNFTKEDIRKILNTICWCGFIMAVFVVLQFLFLDQFFIAKQGTYHEQWNLAGTIGHPTFVSAYIAMIIPLMIYLKKYWFAAVMAGVVLLTQSQVAIGAMALSLIFLLSRRYKKYAILALVGFILLIASVNIIHPGYISDSNRFFEWNRIIHDINTPMGANEIKHKFPITGLGLGSFYYTYHIIHSNSFFQAHNEYLEWLWNCGIVGLALFLLAIFWMVRANWNKNHYRDCLLASFFCIAINAGGAFVWQLGATMFPTALIVGLLHNKES